MVSDDNTTEPGGNSRLRTRHKDVRHSVVDRGKEMTVPNGQRWKLDGNRDILPCKQASLSQGQKLLVGLEDGPELGKSIGARRE